MAVKGRQENDAVVAYETCNKQWRGDERGHNKSGRKYVLLLKTCICYRTPSVLGMGVSATSDGVAFYFLCTIVVVPDFVSRGLR